MTDGQSEACEANAVPSVERMHLIDRVRLLEARLSSQSRAIAGLANTLDILKTAWAIIKPDEELVAEVEADQAKCKELRRKVEFGQGLTITEQRWAVEQLTGQPIPQRRRCGECHGDGTVLDAVASAREGLRIYFRCCTCDGSGYAK